MVRRHTNAYCRARAQSPPKKSKTELPRKKSREKVSLEGSLKVGGNYSSDYRSIFGSRVPQSRFIYGNQVELEIFRLINMRIFHNSILSVSSLLVSRVKQRPILNTLHLSTMSAPQEWIPTGTIEELFETALAGNKWAGLSIDFFQSPLKTHLFQQQSSTASIYPFHTNFLGINAPTAGARTQKDLPVGKTCPSFSLLEKF